MGLYISLCILFPMFWYLPISASPSLLSVINIIFNYRLALAL